VSAAETRTFPDVDVVIVAHDSGDLLERAVASVESQVAAGRVIVVDTESADGSVAAMAAAHPSVRVIAVPNKGFAAANNVGITATSGECVLLLNPDAELEERGLRQLVSRLHSNRSAAIVAPKVTDPDGSVQAGSYGQFPTLPKTLIGHLNRLAHRMSGGRFRSTADITQTMPVDWVTGACMLVRRSAIEKAGPMDETFFLYYEDVEWCHRMHDKGYIVLIEPTACCTHRRGGSGGGDSPAAQKAYRESFYRYCDIYGLYGLATVARLGLNVRRLLGDRP
jgi:N-acetylglucosaminyl-diphospho-decaprenol L-rhamnosyltransferase